MEEVNTPPRSIEYLFTSSLVLALGAVDLALMLQFASFFDVQSILAMIVLIIVLFSFSLIMLMIHFRVKYVITDDRLVIKQLFSERKILLKDIKEVSRHKLGYLRNLLWEIYPTYTIREGVMIKMNSGAQIFISPSGRDDFIGKIVRKEGI